MSKNDDSPTLPSLNPTSGAAVDVWRRRRLLLRELVFESLPLLFALVVLRLKCRVLLLKLDYLAFKRLVLLFRKRKSLAQDRGGPVLSNQPLDVGKDAHALAPSVVVDGIGGFETPNVRAEAGPTAKRQARVVENAPAHYAGLVF